MKQEPTDREPIDQESKANTAVYLWVLSLSVGLAVGVGIGAAIGRIGAGVGIGVGAGVAVGLFFLRRAMGDSGDD